MGHQTRERRPILPTSLSIIFAMTIAGLLYAEPVPVRDMPVKATGEAVESGTTTISLASPPRLFLILTTGERLRARVEQFDPQGMSILNDDNQSRRIPWMQIGAERVGVIYDQLLELASNVSNTDKAMAWFELGRHLYKVDGYAGVAQRALTRAGNLDSSLQPRIERVRLGLPDESLASDTTKADDIGSALLAVDNSDRSRWSTLTSAQHEEAIDELKLFAEQTQQRLSLPLQLLETQYFLFYTDIAPVEAARWAGLLDRMYHRLSQLFGVERNSNIWRGKALVFVFHKAEDYHRFQSIMHRTNSVGTMGMCHSFANGEVHIAFFRQNDERSFAHVLVHESVHGFLHRYRSPQRIPSWANEGLAELIAEELVPASDWVKRKEHWAKRTLEANPVLEDSFFTAEQIQSWHYGIASGLAKFMLKSNRAAYVRFINNTKDGLPWEQSLKESFNTTPAQLIQLYGQSLGIKSLMLR